MFENLINFFKKVGKKDQIEEKSKNTAKERLHLVLMQDRANVSADFLDMMRQEIIEVIKKYIDVDEKDIDVKLTNKANEDGTTGAPALYANIPITGIKEEMKKDKEDNKETKDKDFENDKKEKDDKKENIKENDVEEKKDKEVAQEQEDKDEKNDEIQQNEEKTEKDTEIVEEQESKKKEATVETKSNKKSSNKSKKKKSNEK